MKKSIYYLLVSIALLRVFTVLYINKTPCMETTYYGIGKALSFDKIENITLSPLYSILVYKLSVLTGSLFYASSFLFILSSLITCIYLYLLTKYLFDEKIAEIVLILLLFFPNLTVSLAGYSHSVIVGTAIEIAAIYYIVKSFSHFKLPTTFAGIALSSISIMIRPENLLIFSLLYCSFTVYNILINKNIKRPAALALIYFISLFALTQANAYYVRTKSKDVTYAGIFTDNRYGYLTMIHTYSLRYHDVIDDKLAIEASTPFVGTPESNNYSIFALITKNPKQFLTNCLYNLKEMLDTMAHPLFMPFFYFTFLGIYLKKNSFSPQEKQSFWFVILLLLFHTLPLLIFHIEIRYMIPLSVLLLIIFAKAISLSEHKGIILVTTTLLTFLIYLAYLVNFHNISSMCV